MFVLLCLLCVCQSANPLLGSSDFWAHAAVGRWIWQNGALPGHTLFLWTASEPWVAHSWLGEVILYGLLDLGGTWLARGFVMAMTAAAFLLIARLWLRNAPPSTLMVVVFGVAVNCSATRFEARPELFSTLFLSALLVILCRWSDLLRSLTLPARQLLAVLILPVLFCVWVNCHGQVLMGLGLLGATVICELLQERFSRRAWLLALSGVLSGAALLLNPYGLGYLKAYQATASITFGTIREWQPFWAPPAMPAGTIVQTAGLLLLALLSWYHGPRRRWCELIWLLLLGLAFLRAVRFIIMLNLASLAVMAANAGVLDVKKLRRIFDEPKPAGQVDETRWQRLCWLARAAVFIWLLASFAEPLGRITTLESRGFIVPRDVADFIGNERIPGRMFNDYENSSYFHWRFGGDPPLFIDLLNVYPDTVLLDYRDIMQVTPRGRKLLDEMDIGYVVLTRHREGLSADPLANYLYEQPDWAFVYGTTASDGIVLVRRTPQYEYLWRRKE